MRIDVAKVDENAYRIVFDGGKYGSLVSVVLTADGANHLINMIKKASEGRVWSKFEVVFKEV